MKAKISDCAVILAVTLLVPQKVQTQGTTFLSNLNQTPTGIQAVASDAWFAESFLTGTNVGGYLLNSVQMAMTNAFGSPNSFSLLLYSAVRPAEFYPGDSLFVLNGTGNPSGSGVFTYNASNIMLMPDTVYFLVVTAGTTAANGAYGWSLGGTGYNPSGGWRAPMGFSGQDTYSSGNGLNWVWAPVNPQFAITATPIPEPDTLSLFGLGALAGFWRLELRSFLRRVKVSRKRFEISAYPRASFSNNWPKLQK